MKRLNDIKSLLIGAEAVLVIVVIILGFRAIYGEPVKWVGDEYEEITEENVEACIRSSAKSAETAVSAAETAGAEAQKVTAAYQSAQRQIALGAEEERISALYDTGWWASADFDEAGEALYNGGAASPDETSITILGTGDNLVHSAIYQNAMTGSGYDFTPYYEYLKGFISSADIATVNQESPIATSILPVSGYPEFNTPEEAGYALLDEGFDVINEGNNHIMDQGTEGALATLDFWDSLGVPYVGFYRNEEDRDTIRVVERKGIKVAFLGIVEMLNYPLSDSNTCKVIWTKDEDRIRDLLTKASSMADVVVVHVHWGEENESEVEDHVTELAQKMVDWGADIIYGNHPHLLRDIDILTRESDGKKCPVAYSLGNFLNGQTNPWQVVSGLMTVTCVRNQVTGEVDPQYMSFLPVIMHYSGNRTNGRLYPICLYSSDLAASHGVARFGSSLSMSYIMNILEDKVPEEYRNRVGRIPN